MRLSEHVCLVGSGSLGFGMSDEYDCHVYAIDGGTELALVDAGAGRTIEPILKNLRSDGLDPARLRRLLLTHAHADHAGAAAEWRARFGVEVAASAESAAYLRAGDESKISLDIARRAGSYPADYVFRPCEVARVLAEGDEVSIGNLSLRVFETPGHSSGMLAFLLNENGRRFLFTGDTVFHGGKVCFLYTWDCLIPPYAASLAKLAALEADALLPGHLAISLSGGSKHIRKANDYFERMLLPPSIT